MTQKILKPKVAIYSRVSTEEQAKEGLSVEAQVDKCKSFCDAREWEVFKVYKDAGFSAGSLNRPALELLLRDAQEKRFDIILVYKIDRFSRKLKDLITILEELKAQGINFTSVTEQIDTTSAMGEAFFQIIGVFAQLERGMVKERVQLSFDRKISLGEALYRAPFGYTYQNKKLIRHPENGKTLLQAEAKFCNPFVLQAPNKPPAHMPAQRFKVRLSDSDWWKGFGRARLLLRGIPA